MAGSGGKGGGGEVTDDDGRGSLSCLYDNHGGWGFMVECHSVSLFSHVGCLLCFVFVLKH